MTDDAERPCPGCGEDLYYTVRGTRYSRATSVEIRGVYDGGLFYAHTVQSGGCGRAWHRWEGPSRLRVKAQKYIDEWNQRWFASNGTADEVPSPKDESSDGV